MSEVRIVSGRWRLEGAAEPPDDSMVGTPERRPASVRRTSHVNATWPRGLGEGTRLRGRARDLVTDAGGDPVVRGEGRIELELDATQTVASATTEPARPRGAALVGAHAIRGFRAAVDAALPEDRAEVSALSFLLEDVPAASMIGATAWSQQQALTYDKERGGAARAYQRTASGAIACSGLRPGGYHDLSIDRGATFPHWVRLAGDLSSADPWAWHEIDPADEVVCFRRRRRLDAWRNGPAIEVDAHFRDSIWGPAGDELALHEYSLTATIDAATRTLLAVDARSRVLPFPECPTVTAHVNGLVGTDVCTLRPTVHKMLTELHACTHLNDMLRGLAEIPALVTSIPG